MMQIYEMQDEVLGMLLRDYKRYWPIAKAIGFYPEIFLEIDRMNIASAIKLLSDSNSPVTYASVLTACVNCNVALLSQLPINASLEINFEWLLSQLTIWYKLKNLVLEVNDISTAITSAKNSSDPTKIIVSLGELFKKACSHIPNSGSCFNMESSIASMISRIEKRVEDSLHGIKRGYSTGIKRLDESISGLIAGRFYIIAARTSVGKTTFATSLCHAAMKAGAQPLFFSNEMDKEDIIEKFVSNEGKINATKMQLGIFDDRDLNNFSSAVNNIAKLKINIDEKSGWNLDKLIETATRQHRDGKCDIVFVDYLQQVRVRGSQFKHEQVSIVSDAMKKLSRDLNIPVIGMAQINREAEKNNNNEMPRLSNIKDSGSLEQDADVVMILHKHELGDFKVDLSVSKNRHGATGTIFLNHVAKFNTYEER